MASGVRRIGIVAIGRNEGERLRHCLASARPHCAALVYVDSGSTDGSVELARTIGAAIVELDPTVPFTAARARNAGFSLLSEILPGIEFVQFIDGDCELDANWIERALPSFGAAEVAIVCGRRRERYPERSIYNLLCDMEWDTPIGVADECGGDALMRASTFRESGGFTDTLIAGEEPELCVRLRRAGWRILRIDHPMTLHDARMASFRQWWTRAVRAGHANAEGNSLHARAASARSVREVRSAWLWGIVLPLAIAASSLAHSAISLGLLLLYPVQVARIVRHKPRPNFPRRDQWYYAAACVLGKLPNAQGQLRFHLGRATGRRSKLIEYKTSPGLAKSPDAQ